jgi:hypothetical protein
MRALLVAVLLLGCTPSPTEVCAHWATLRKSVDPDDERKCNLHLSGEQESHPNGYRCEARCIMRATTAEGAAECRNSCL